MSPSESNSEAGVDLDIRTARVFLPLLATVRYKGTHGGRGSGKSHFVADTLIEETLRGHQRIACTREYQSSIGESVKQLLEDKINKQFAIGSLFDITDKEIRGPHDSLFIFKGLQKHTIDSIKSFEGFTRFWNEEAHTTSQHSLETACPTFRKGSELYFTWNPKKEDDPVDVFFRENKGDPDFACVEANYRDNPWFPMELRRDMERDKRRDPEKYAHIWMGKYQSRSEARVFSNWTIEPFETPPDSRFYLGADWGFSIDPTVLIRCFEDRANRKLYVDYEAYKIGCKIGDTPKLFDKVPNARKWRICADSARPETIDYMKDNGYPKIDSALKGAGSVEDGIEFLKSYDIIVHPRCVHTADELAFYSYKTDKKTEEVLPVLSDKKNHVIDALRYAVENIRRGKSMQVTPEFAHALANLTKQRHIRIPGLTRRRQL